MNAVLTIARRELAEKKIVFLAAAIFGVGPFVAFLTPNPTIREDLISLIGTVMAAGFTGGLALILGATIVGNELTSRRLSFYYSKPLSGPSIWFGKVTAALVMIVSSLTIVLVPSMLWVRMKAAFVELPTLVGATLALSLALFLIGHAAGTMVRGRSALLALDFLLTVGFVAACYFIVRPYMMNLARNMFLGVSIGLGSLLMIALLGAGAWQMAEGRTERRQSHIALSKFLWISLAVVVAIGGAFTAWVVSATPRDINAVYDAEQPPSGSQAFIVGKARGRGDYIPSFLVNLEDGTYERTSTIPGYYVPGFTVDGKTLYWQSPDKGHELMLRSADRGAQTIATGFTVPYTSRVHISDDASMAAYFDRNSGIMGIYDIRKRASLGAVRLPAPGREWTFFPSADRVHVVIADDSPKGDNVVRSFDYDVSKRVLTPAGTVTVPHGVISLQTSAKGSIITVRTDTVGESRGVVIDAATGRQLAELGEHCTVRVRLLEDGRIAYSYPAGPTEHLRVIDFSGATLADFDLGIKGAVAIRDEVAPGKLVLSHRDDDEKTQKLLVADVDAAKVLRSEDGLRAGTMPNWGWDGHDPRARVVSRPQLVMNRSGELWRWNPLTGEKKLAIGG